MLPFRRKKVEEEEKDLKAELPVKKIRRRKKAEPPKPWSKKERFVVFFLLILIPVLSLSFFLKSKNQTPLLNSTKILGDMSSNNLDVNTLKNELTKETQNLQGTYGIWLEAVDGSYSLGINEKETFDGASLFKLPLMIGFYEEVQKGNINPDTNYTIKYSDAQLGAGVLATYPPGTVVTYRDVVNAMGKDSDNTAFSIMQNILDPNLENSVIAQIGMNDTSFDESLTTPKDIGLLFYQLTNTSIISDNFKKELLNSLTSTQYEALIPSAIPTNIQVAHKYAADEDTLNDAGIIYTRKPFILVIMSKNNSTEAQTEIPRLARIIYSWAGK